MKRIATTLITLALLTLFYVPTTEAQYKHDVLGEDVLDKMSQTLERIRTDVERVKASNVTYSEHIRVNSYGFALLTSVDDTVKIIDSLHNKPSLAMSYGLSNMLYLLETDLTDFSRAVRGADLRKIGDDLRSAGLELSAEQMRFEKETTARLHALDRSLSELPVKAQSNDE